MTMLRRFLATFVALSLCVVVPRAQTSAAPLDGWTVGFPTVDGDVVILISEGGDLYLPQRDFEALPNTTQMVAFPGTHLTGLPASLTTPLVGEKAHVGDAWTIDVPGIGRIHATVDRFVLGYRSCGEAWGVLLKPVASDRPRFQPASAPFVLARPGTFDPPARTAIGSLGRALSPNERPKVSALLEAARTNAMGDVRHRKPLETRSPYPARQRAWIAKWAALDKALDGHRARLVFDADLYRLTPDGEPRVFVRARWMVGDDVAYALSAWIRLASQPTIESVDVSPAQTMRIIDEGVHEWDRAIPKVLGVFDVNGDGRAEVLMRSELYEGSDHFLIEYPLSPAEPPRALFHYGDGC